MARHRRNQNKAHRKAQRTQRDFFLFGKDWTVSSTNVILVLARKQAAQDFHENLTIGRNLYS